MFRQDALQKWRKVTRLNYNNSTTLGATVRFQRSKKSSETSKASGSQKGKENGREPDSPGSTPPSPGVQFGFRPDPPRTRLESARFSACSTGSEDSWDGLPLLLGSESIDDLDFGNAQLCFNMPFGFLKKKKESKNKEQAEKAVFLKDQDPDRNGGQTTYGTQPLDPGHETGHGESSLALLAKEDDDHHSLNDSGVESQYGESSKETSPEPELPSKLASECGSQDNQTNHGKETTAEHDDHQGTVTEHPDKQEGDSDKTEDKDEKKGDEEVLFESFTTLRDNLQGEPRPGQQVPLVEDLISINIEEEEDEGAAILPDETMQDGKVELSLYEETGTKESEGRPLIDKSGGKKRFKLLCCTIM